MSYSSDSVDKSIVITNVSSKKVKACIGRFNDKQMSKFYDIDSYKQEIWERDQEKMHVVNIVSENPTFDFNILVEARERIIIEDFEKNCLLIYFFSKSGQRRAYQCCQENRSCDQLFRELIKLNY
ncbi:hypothetical protein DICPUDRAFT_156913 [Dictyostelium purpureum]|uniref:Uncharacterized protein n=1 Tax=Dictyostelium purpureum TaxID=5786 RepID=F0ZXS2_DICPU|nr:uncharacterized protein DICPUDRAFT_156913 [Dictyostelium purpureum]EGC31274.1 hypothetical protein DICPUDRAFT_156913 [Dictyostelium purpureum]|eukprot:XP_003292219.1 hypothetical protein DICPUDRAFT_156913 [Dictyostelium purpureum]